MPRLRNVLIRVRGGEPLPAEHTLVLERGERTLTWGRVRGGGLAVVTDFRLVVLQPDAGVVSFRWHDVGRATWTEGVLHVETMDGMVADYLLTEPRGVPAAIREHVNASVVLSEHHELAPGVGVRVVARRDLQSGALVWSTVFDPGVDGADPVLRQHAGELLAAVRRRYGG